MVELLTNPVQFQFFVSLLADVDGCVHRIPLDLSGMIPILLNLDKLKEQRASTIRPRRKSKKTFSKTIYIAPCSHIMIGLIGPDCTQSVHSVIIFHSDVLERASLF